jgi:hypothetical protein
LRRFTDARRSRLRRKLSVRLLYHGRVKVVDRTSQGGGAKLYS